MRYDRVDRVGELLKQEIALVIHSELRDPRVGPVSVTAVRVAADLTFARVFCLPVGTDEERKETLEALQRTASFIRTRLSHSLELRRVPELRFVLDETLDRARRMDEIIGKLAHERIDAPKDDPPNDD